MPRCCRCSVLWPLHIVVHALIECAYPYCVLVLLQAQLDAEVLSVRRELSAEYRRRLDALEAEWATRASTRSTELEAAHSLKLQQVS